jgi:hypothetical protein
LLYIFIGTGLGIYKFSHPGVFLPSFFPLEQKEHFPLVAVADRNGKIKWFYFKNLTVLEIDGQHPSELL